VFSRAIVLVFSRSILRCQVIARFRIHFQGFG
jgi:hypothetical protein